MTREVAGAAGRLVGVAEASVPEAGPVWVSVGDASARLGFPAALIMRLIQDGDLPAMQVAAPAGCGGQVPRHLCRIPRRLVDEAYQAVMAGGQVELRGFAREWAARQ